MQPAKVLFVPVGIASGVAAGLVARKAFGLAWKRISSTEEAPEPDQEDASMGALATALALEGAISRLSSGLVERAARVGFQRATGSWPGDERHPE